MKKKRVLKKIAAARERHFERHRPSGCQFAIADSVRQLRPEEWDSLTTTSSFFLRRAYLEVLETALPEGVVPRYALAYRDGVPVAAVAMQAVTIRLDRLRKLSSRAGEKSSSEESGSRRKARVPAPPALGKLGARVLVCGNLLSWGSHGIAMREGEDPERVWPAVAEALYRVRRADRLSGQPSLVLVKDLEENKWSGIESLERFSYRPLETEPNMLLTLPAGCRSYDDYLAALTARYRKTAKKTAQAIEKAGLQVETLNDLTPHADRIHELYLKVHGRARIRLVTLHPQYISALAGLLGEQFRCTTIRDGDEILGFVTTLKDGDVAVGYYIGFDAAANQEHPIYFRLLQAVVDDAIRLGCRRISLGRTALEPKAKLGAEPVTTCCWLRHRIPVMNLVVRQLLRTITHEEAPERKPFK